MLGNYKKSITVFLV